MGEGWQKIEAIREDEIEILQMKAMIEIKSHQKVFNSRLNLAEESVNLEDGIF